MVPVPIKMQQPLGILDPNNLQINTSCPHPGVIHTSPQTPNIVSFENIITDTKILKLLKHFYLWFLECTNKYIH